MRAIEDEGDGLSDGGAHRGLQMRRRGLLVGQPLGQAGSHKDGPHPGSARGHHIGRRVAHHHRAGEVKPPLPRRL